MRFIKKLLVIAIILSNLVVAQDYMDYANAKANTLAPKLTKWQKIVHRANIMHSGYNYYKYEPYTTHKHYTDCSKYYATNCNDIRFSECWECRAYTCVVEPHLPYRGYYFLNAKESY